MFDIGFWEIVLITIMALVVIGPERLPDVARTAGRMLGKFRRYIEGVKTEVGADQELLEMKRQIHNQMMQMKEMGIKMDAETMKARQAMSYNLDDDGKKVEDSDSSDDYLEFMNEDEEKDHLQILAEKKRQHEEFMKQHEEMMARKAKEAENAPAAAAEDKKNDEVVASKSEDKSSRNDG